MTDYENMSIEQLEKLTYEYIRRNRPYGGTSERAPSINDISRALIEAIRREKGTCFLSKINLTGKERDNSDYHFTPYVGQTIYNFDYTLALPQEDEALRQLIIEHNRAHMPYDSKSAFERIQRISDRVDEIGAFRLLWA